MNIEKLTENQKNFFSAGHTLDYDFRRKQLKKLHRLLKENDDQIMDAVDEDFGKPRFETYGTEIAVTLQEIQYHLKYLKRWMKPQKVRNSILTFPASSRIYHQPYGNTLILSPWNYPLQLAFMPLVGAMSAGNTMLLKPSELTPRTSGTIANLISETFDPAYITVAEGGVETSREILRHPFDYIFFTGSTRVGKIVMQAASEHFTPLTLELGGKSPAIVHRDADVGIAARRIWWGKMINSGQTCVGPDYVLVHKNVKELFVESSKKELAKFSRKKKSEELPGTRIINRENYQRLSGLIPGQEILIGGEGDPDKLMIEPTMFNADWDDPSMQDEIFGPLLPMIVYENIDRVIEIIRNRPSPLALYLFTNSKELEHQVIRKIPFGGGCINDTLSHLGNPNLPFGGIGKSGFGSYHGKQSFTTFSYQKSVLKKPLWPDFKFRYPPYSKTAFAWVRKLYR